MMSGQWQQYPPNPGLYQQQSGYGQTVDFSQSGYHQPGYAQGTVYPQQSGYEQAYNPQQQAGGFSHQPHQSGYPQQGGYVQPQSGYPKQPQQANYHHQQSGYPQTPQSTGYPPTHYQQSPDGGYSQPQQGVYQQQGAYFQQSGSFPHPQQGAFPQQPNSVRYAQHSGQYAGQPTPPYNSFPPQAPPSQPYTSQSYQAAPYTPTPPYQPPQQYPTPQQYSAPQQYSTSQPALPQQAENNCFNCGAPDHWAQECPEPRRQIPYGQVMQANRTQKRFRPNHKPPIITKYPVPPHVVNAQPTPPYSAPPTWNQQPPPYPTPSTAVPSPAQSWPEQGLPQTETQRYPQIPTPDSQSKHFEQRRPSVISHDVLTPPYGSEQHAIQSHDSQPVAANNAGKPPAPPAMSRSHSKASATSNQSVSMATESDDEDDEEYLRLDIPDLPNLNCYGGAKPPQLVAEPLPALSESDEVGKLARPEGEKIRSKYYDAAMLDLLEANVRNLSEFEGLEDDPMFLALLEDRPRRGSTPLRKTPRESPHQYPPRSRRSASPAFRDEPFPEGRPRSRRDRTPIYRREASAEEIARSRRGGTPINKREYHEGTPPLGFDPFDPATGNLDDLIRKHYPDAVLKKGCMENAPPPPPPPPPPPEPYYPREYPNTSSRRHRGYSVHSPEALNNWGGDGHESSPTEHSMRKRKHSGEETPRREGQRQRDTTMKRRTAPKVADVYSRRW